MKRQKPSNSSIYIEISVLILFFIVLLTPIIVAARNHYLAPEESTPTNSSSPENTYPSEPTPTPSQPPAEQNPTPTAPTEQPNTPTPPANPTTPSCHHEEEGICWDELEEANYSAGLYDRENDNYGATIDYPDSCNSVCRDIIDDAYEEGWYDGGY